MSRELTKSARERYIRVVAIVLKITEGIGQSCVIQGLQRQLPSYCSTKRGHTELTTSRAGSSSINILNRGREKKGSTVQIQRYKYLGGQMGIGISGIR